MGKFIRQFCRLLYLVIKLFVSLFVAWKYQITKNLELDNVVSAILRYVISVACHIYETFKNLRLEVLKTFRNFTNCHVNDCSGISKLHMRKMHHTDVTQILHLASKFCRAILDINHRVCIR